MALLTKDQILKADDIRTEIVPVPEWGGEVKVRTLPCDELDEYELSLSERSDADRRSIRAPFCAQCIVDDTGARMFNVLEVAALGKKSGRALDRVFDACQRINGRRAKDVEDAAKNSPSGQSAASGSSSATGTESPSDTSSVP